MPSIEFVLNREEVNRQLCPFSSITVDASGDANDPRWESEALRQADMSGFLFAPSDIVRRVFHAEPAGQVFGTAEPPPRGRGRLEGFLSRLFSGR